MILKSSDSILTLNTKDLTTTSITNLGTDSNDITTVNGDITFTQRVIFDKKMVYNAVRSEGVTNTFYLATATPSLPLIDQNYRYHYFSSSLSNAYCNLWSSGVTGNDGATITIMNRGSASVRIFGNGGWLVSSTVTKSPPLEQRIMDHRGNIVESILLGQTDWVELVEAPTLNTFGWIITEAVGI